MTREEALHNLNLPPDADPEAVEKAYQRLVRRYPPEFHPDRFRVIDDSYRQLKSLPAMIEKLLSPACQDTRLNSDFLVFDPFLPEDCLEKALDELKNNALTEALWGKAPQTRAPKSPRR